MQVFIAGVMQGSRRDEAIGVQDYRTIIAQVLQEHFPSVEIVDPNELPSDKAYFGTTLELKNLNSGDVLKWTLVSQDEADLAAGKISITSPIGKGLLGKAPNEIAEIQVPAGLVKYKILKISRE